MNSAEQLAIAHHSARVFRYATYLADQEQPEGLERDLLFHACLLHDIGASEIGSRPGRFGVQRFEVQGADLASQLLDEQGCAPSSQAHVWQAIALHTTPQVAERMGLSAVVVEQALADPARAPQARWPAALQAAHQASTDPSAEARP